MQRRRLHDAVAGGEHLAAVGLHPRDDGRAGDGVAGARRVVRQELERADGVHQPVADERQALHVAMPIRMPVNDPGPAATA